MSLTWVEIQGVAEGFRTSRKKNLKLVTDWQKMQENPTFSDGLVNEALRVVRYEVWQEGEVESGDGLCIGALVSGNVSCLKMVDVKNGTFGLSRSNTQVRLEVISGQKETDTDVSVLITGLFPTEGMIRLNRVRNFDPSNLKKFLERIKPNEYPIKKGFDIGGLTTEEETRGAFYEALDFVVTAQIEAQSLPRQMREAVSNLQEKFRLSELHWQNSYLPWSALRSRIAG